MIKEEIITLNSELRTPNSFEHGGNIYALAEELRVPEDRIIDFSTSINPLGISKKVEFAIIKGLKNLHNYPDTDTKRLREVLAQHHGINPETILCGNGSTELIYLIPRVLNPRKVLIPAPTFSEYERACRTRNYKLQITNYKLQKENNFAINPDEFISSLVTCLPSRQARHLSLPFNMAFLCNPNNPTGRLLEKNDVLRIADAARKLKCYLVVDEAFIDFCPGSSVIGSVHDNPYLIVLRSMTKFYALTGLRMGYGVFHTGLIKKLKEFKEPWTVNSLAQEAAIAALGDSVYAYETLKLIKNEKQFFESSFKKAGVEFFPSTANFYLLRINDDARIDLKLRQKGILVRDCSNFKGLDNSYIRVAVKSRKHNKILLNEITKFYPANNGCHSRKSGNPEKRTGFRIPEASGRNEMTKHGIQAGIYSVKNGNGQYIQDEGYKFKNTLASYMHIILAQTLMLLIIL